MTILLSLAENSKLVTGCVLGLAVVVIFAVRWRMRQLVLQERARSELRLRERERIARELHDDLVEGTQGFVLNVEGAARLLEEASPVRKILEGALAGADRVMLEGRDRIRHLRTLGIDPTDLPEALEQFGQALSQASPIRCVVQVDGRMRTLQDGVGDELFRIAREAMTNAFRHANARSVEVQVIYADDQLRLRVRDDGTGYEIDRKGSGVVAGRWGLDGMRDRASAIGAQLETRTHVGVGSEVELRIAASRAFVRR